MRPRFRLHQSDHRVRCLRCAERGVLDGAAADRDRATHERQTGPSAVQLHDQFGLQLCRHQLQHRQNRRGLPVGYLHS